MTLEFFLTNYEINEFEVKKIYVKDNKLFLDLIMPIHLDLIANGYRPELDLKQEKTFIFYVDSIDKIYAKEAKITFTKDDIFINKDRLKITLSKVDIL